MICSARCQHASLLGLNVHWGHGLAVFAEAGSGEDSASRLRSSCIEVVLDDGDALLVHQRILRLLCEDGLG